MVRKLFVYSVYAEMYFYKDDLYYKYDISGPYDGGSSDIIEEQYQYDYFSKKLPEEVTLEGISLSLK